MRVLDKLWDAAREWWGVCFWLLCSASFLFGVGPGDLQSSLGGGVCVFFLSSLLKYSSYLILLASGRRWSLVLTAHCACVFTLCIRTEEAESGQEAVSKHSKMAVSSFKSGVMLSGSNQRRYQQRCRLQCYGQHRHLMPPGSLRRAPLLRRGLLLGRQPTCRRCQIVPAQGCSPRGYFECRWKCYTRFR